MNHENKLKPFIVTFTSSRLSAYSNDSLSETKSTFVKTQLELWLSEYLWRSDLQVSLLYNTQVIFEGTGQDFLNLLETKTGSELRTWADKRTIKNTVVVPKLPSVTQELIYGFVELSWVKQLLIAKKMGLTKKGDDLHNRNKAADKFIEKARTTGRLADLWDEVFGNSKNNPYK
jgi:hypothetical protein